MLLLGVILFLLITICLFLIIYLYNLKMSQDRNWHLIKFIILSPFFTLYLNYLYTYYFLTIIIKILIIYFY